MSSRKNCSISCTNCRARKRKCDAKDICHNCSSRGLTCERPHLDKRRERPTSKETQQLRETNASLDSALARIYEAISTVEGQEARESLFDLLTSHPAASAKARKKKIPMSVDVSSGGEFSVYGPTSAIHNLLSNPTISKPEAEIFKSASNDPSFTEALKNFFTWMYPDVTVFIHRESFLGDFLSPNQNRGYCSEELVYSIAALGAKCSDSPSLRELAPTFYERARSNIFSRKIYLPQINTLQALLCLSLYELGDGNTSASWMLSGMAFRMGYDLGFQLNPSDWTVDEQGPRPEPRSLIVESDITIRSRIYWGCYILDSFISLIMGRPVTVRKTEASIPSSEVLPNSTKIDAFIYHPAKDGNNTNENPNLDAFQTIEPLCLLGECAGSLLTEIYSGEGSDDKGLYLDRKKLRSYNAFLSKWRDNLPEPLKWTRASLEHQSYNPTSMNFKLYYYIVIISLNRPFLGMQGTEGKVSSRICDEASEELCLCLSRFRDSGGYPSILILYSSVLAMSITLATIQKVDDAILDKKIQQLKICYFIVSKARANWQLAAKSMVFIHKKIEELQVPQIAEALNLFNEEDPIAVPQPDLLNFMSMSPDASFWGTQDNLFANFFDFMDH